MNLVQQTTLDRPAIGTRGHATSGVAIAVYAAVILAVAAAIVAFAIMTRSLATPTQAAAAIGSDQWREFRAGERAPAFTADPWLDPAFVAFRQSERAEAAGK